MTPASVLSLPFIQVALPIMLTMLVAVWVNNKAFDGIHKRLDDLVARVGRIEDRLLGIENRMTGIERKVDALELKAWR